MSDKRRCLKFIQFIPAYCDKLPQYSGMNLHTCYALDRKM